MQPSARIAADHVGERAAAIDPKVPVARWGFFGGAALRVHVWLISGSGSLFAASPLMVLSLRQIKRETRRLRHGNREVWQNRHAGVAALSWLHDLRLDEMARMGAGGGGVAAVHPRGAGKRHQFFRHG